MGYIQYVVGRFSTGRSGSPYSLCSTDAEPKGPFVVLNTKKTRGECPNRGTIYLVEVEWPEEFNARTRFAKRIVTDLHAIRNRLVRELRTAVWKRDKHGNIAGIISDVVKTEDGYFRPHYHRGDDRMFVLEPYIWLEAIEGPESPYAEALSTPLARASLVTIDEDCLKCAKNAL
jgi:hypothetical protein